MLVSVLMVAEKPSLAQSIAQFLSNGQVRTVCAALNNMLPCSCCAAVVRTCAACQQLHVVIRAPRVCLQALV
jgi:DNA topoisomerase IA